MRNFTDKNQVKSFHYKLSFDFNSTMFIYIHIYYCELLNLPTKINFLDAVIGYVEIISSTESHKTRMLRSGPRQRAFQIFKIHHVQFESDDAASSNERPTSY